MEKEQTKEILKQTLKEMFVNDEIKINVEFCDASDSHYTRLKVYVVIDDEVISTSSDDFSQIMWLRKLINENL